MTENGQEPVEQMEEGVAIEKHVIQVSKITMCEKHGDGLKISCIVNEGNQPVQRTMIIGEQGKRVILDAITGGIEIAFPVV